MALLAYLVLLLVFLVVLVVEDIQDNLDNLEQVHILIFNYIYTLISKINISIMLLLVIDILIQISLWQKIFID